MWRSTARLSDAGPWWGVHAAGGLELLQAMRVAFVALVVGPHRQYRGSETSIISSTIHHTQHTRCHFHRVHVVVGFATVPLTTCSSRFVELRIGERFPTVGQHAQSGSSHRQLSLISSANNNVQCMTVLSSWPIAWFFSNYGTRSRNRVAPFALLCGKLCHKKGLSRLRQILGRS